MKCLVTGATGFLGTNLVHQLVDQGWEVRALALPGSQDRYISALPVELVSGDITDKACMNRHARGVDVVFHVAGDTSFWKRRYARQREVNVQGPVTVAQACVLNGVRRLVHTSTIDALGYNPCGLADENWPTYNFAGMGYNYGDTKHAGEQLVRSFNGPDLEVVVVYPGSMLGPWDHTMQFGRLFCDLKEGRLPGCPCGGTSFGHVTEVARAHVLAAVRGRPGSGYICAGENASYRELINLIARRVAKEPPRLDLPGWMLTLYGYAAEAWSVLSGRPPDINPGQARFMSVTARYNSSRAVEDLGYRVLPLAEMVDDAWVWYRENGFI